MRSLRYGVPNRGWNLRKEEVRDVMLDVRSGPSYAGLAEYEVGTAATPVAQSEVHVRASESAPLASTDYSVNRWRCFSKYAIARCNVNKEYMMRDVM